jgi:maleate isomerase
MSLMRAQRRLGLVVPSSNTVVESATPALLPADGSMAVHVARLRITRIADDDSSDAQFARERELDAFGALADARVDLLVWAGTAASWLGIQHDDSLVADAEALTGIRTTSSTLALLARLDDCRAARIGLVTPYTEGIERRLVATYATRGLEVARAARCDLIENTEFANVSEEHIAGMVRSVARDVDAVAIVCTNLFGAGIAPILERELGIPVLDSVRVTIEAAREMLA